MKIADLKERIEKKQAQIEKKQNTITKKQAQIAKKQATLEKMGFNENTMDFGDNRDARWIDYDIRNLKRDIERGASEIEECKKTLEKYQKQLAGEIEKEETFIKEVPQAMKTLEVELIEQWDKDDQRRRAFLQKEMKRLEEEKGGREGHREFMRKYHYSGYEFTMITDEEIHKANVKDARMFILDLLNRVKDITGEVTDWNGIRLQRGNIFPVLNGIVIGKEGRAEVESILAGGYNIQRLHVRVLVKKF